jgi:hypothetical protein
MLKREDTAMFSDGFPCNSRPFIKRMEEILEENRTSNPDSLDKVELAKYRANLFIVIAHCYGQLFHLDSLDIHKELSAILEREEITDEQGSI